MQTQATTQEPGTRLIAGKLSIVDADLNNLHHAHSRIQAAPAILVRESYDALTLLRTSASSVLNAGRILSEALPYQLDRRTAELLLDNVIREMATRPEYHRAFGSKVAALAKAAA